MRNYFGLIRIRRLFETDLRSAKVSRVFSVEVFGAPKENYIFLGAFNYAGREKVCILFC